MKIAAGIELDRLEQFEINVNVVGAAAVRNADLIWYGRSETMCFKRKKKNFYKKKLIF